MKNSIITGVGHFVPENIVTNDDLSKIMETNDQWITERTGIKERRFVDPKKTPDETTATMGVKAAKKAIESAGLTPKDIDFIVFATLSPDYYFPGCGVLVQEMLGCGTVGALDIRNQCSGFIYALSVADKFIKTDTYKNILVIGAEYHSFGLDLTTRGRGVSVIFGDGAGAVVLSGTDDQKRGIMATNMHSEGAHSEELALLSPGTKTDWMSDVIKDDFEFKPKQIYPQMNGQYVFKHAVTRFPEAILENLNDVDLKPQDIDLLIPHQANLRIAQFIQRKLKLNDNQVFNNIQKYGNTTAASIPIALSEAYKEGRIKEGDTLCLAAFGSGFTWGSVLLNW